MEGIEPMSGCVSANEVDAFGVDGVGKHVHFECAIEGCQVSNVLAISECVVFYVQTFQTDLFGGGVSTPVLLSAGVFR